MKFVFELMDSKRNVVDSVELGEYDVEMALKVFEERGHRGNFVLQRAGSRPEAATFIGVFEL